MLLEDYGLIGDMEAAAHVGRGGSVDWLYLCSLWLVSALARNGRVEEARALFERLVGVASGLGLLAEEYDVGRGAASRQLPAGVQPPHADRRGARALRSRGGRKASARLSANPAPAGSPVSRRGFPCSARACPPFTWGFAGSNMNTMINDITEDMDTTVAGVKPPSRCSY
jgi:hypothetical protein